MRTENHKSFLQRIVGKFSNRDLELIDAAYEMAKEGHDHFNQKRESGERYFEHPRCVALIVMDELGVYNRDIIISCLLHDLKEDSFLMKDRRIKLFFGKNVQKIVNLLTKPGKFDPRFSSKENKLDWYFNRIMNSSWEVKVVKLADRLHNLRTLGVCTREKYDEQIAETKKYFIPLIKNLNKERPLVSELFCKEFENFIGKITI